MNKKITAALIIIGGIAAIFGITLVLDLDVVKWLSCNSPFTNAQDKASDLCRELKNAP